MARQEGTSYITAGSSRRAVSLSGVLNNQTLAATTATTGADTTVASYILPASVLNVNGKALRVRCFGVYGATASLSTIKLFIGTAVGAGTAIVTNNNTSAGNTFGMIDAMIIRTGAATQDCIGQSYFGDGTLTPRQMALTYVPTTLSHTAAIALSFTVNQANASNFTARWFIVELLTEGSPE